jgi:hypothetical protein
MLLFFSCLFYAPPLSHLVTRVAFWFGLLTFLPEIVIFFVCATLDSGAKSLSLVHDLCLIRSLNLSAQIVVMGTFVHLSSLSLCIIEHKSKVFNDPIQKWLNCTPPEPVCFDKVQEWTHQVTRGNSIQVLDKGSGRGLQLGEGGRLTKSGYGEEAREWGWRIPRDPLKRMLKQATKCPKNPRPHPIYPPAAEVGGLGLTRPAAKIHRVWFRQFGKNWQLIFLKKIVI